jgi:pseudouridine kinase
VTFSRLAGRPVLVAGGANLDVKARTSDGAVPATSNPGRVALRPGGVARNIAVALARLGEPVGLLAAVGDDLAGAMLAESLAAAGVDTGLLRRSATQTGLYVATLDDRGDLLIGVADMEATEAIGPAEIAAAADAIHAAGCIVADANLRTDALLVLADLAARSGVPFVIEPVSVAKAARVEAVLASGLPVALMTPNRDEIAALSTPGAGSDVAAQAEALRARGVERVIVHCGEAGALAFDSAGVVAVPAVPGPVRDVTGAGDVSLAAALSGLRRGATLAEAAHIGQRAAALARASDEAVPLDLDPGALAP